MQKTTAQSQQERQKTRARLVLFWKPFYKKKNLRAFNVARPIQRDIYQITSPTTCNLHAYRQASELRLKCFFISTLLLSFEQLIHLVTTLFGGESVVGGVMVSWWRVGWHCRRRVHRRMYEIAKMLKLKFKFMLGWKGIDRSIYEISVFHSFRVF